MNEGERGRFADAIRRTIIEQSYRANVGHIGSALSIVDLVAAVMGVARFEGEGERDRVVLCMNPFWTYSKPPTPARLGI